MGVQWTPVTSAQLDALNSNSLGYHGEAWVNESTGEVMVANEGTVPTNTANLLSDTQLSVDAVPAAQDISNTFAQQAIVTAEQMLQGTGVSVTTVDLTGHSLGGYEGQGNTVFLSNLTNNGVQGFSGINQDGYNNIFGVNVSGNLDPSIAADGGEVNTDTLSDGSTITVNIAANGSRTALGEHAQQSSCCVIGKASLVQAIMTIASTNNKLMVEATINNQDIGFIKEGQSAEVKFRIPALARCTERWCKSLTMPSRATVTKRSGCSRCYPLKAF